jgi:hypothetical protein
MIKIKVYHDDIVQLDIKVSKDNLVIDNNFYLNMTLGISFVPKYG